MSATKEVQTNNPFAPIPAELLGPQLPPIEYDKTHTNVVLVPYN